MEGREKKRVKYMDVFICVQCVRVCECVYGGGVKWVGLGWVGLELGIGSGCL